MSKCCTLQNQAQFHYPVLIVIFYCRHECWEKMSYTLAPPQRYAKTFRNQRFLESAAIIAYNLISNTGLVGCKMSLIHPLAPINLAQCSQTVGWDSLSALQANFEWVPLHFNVSFILNIMMVRGCIWERLQICTFNRLLCICY